VRLLVLQGPNLNLLGTREPDKYGRQTLAELHDAMDAHFDGDLLHVQSAHEGVLIDAVHHAAEDGFDGAIVNAAAYTHTSIALRDAFLATQLPFIEVHISNVHAREPFRHRSLLADIAKGSIVGLGTRGYLLALDWWAAQKA